MGMITFSLRLAEELYQKLKALADREHRSINAQIIYILEKYLDQLEKEEQQT